MGTVTKRYLDKVGLEYLVNKIKNEYHKVTHKNVSSGKYSVLLAGATSVTSGKAYDANFSNDIKYDAADKKLTAPKIGATAIYQKTNQVVDTIKTKAPDGTVKTWINSNGTVTIDAITGATGAQGATGVRGVTGKDGVAAGFDTPATVVTVLGENATPTVGVSASGTNTNKKFTFTFGFPKGLRGITGAQGNTGPTGTKGVTGLRGSQGPTGTRGVQGATGGAGFIASVDRQNFTKANWETYGMVGHQENWSNTTIPAGMIAGDLFVVTGCATDTGDGYQLVYKYDPTFKPASTTLRGTCISSHVIARRGATGVTPVTGIRYNAEKDSIAESINTTLSDIGGKMLLPSATGIRSHAEGISTVASGVASHAEGRNTTAVYDSQHVEGYNNIGTPGEIAQHVSGSFNKTVKNALFIIGNGSSNGRSNAMVVGRTGLMQIGSIQAMKESDRASDKYFATDGTIQTTDEYTLFNIKFEASEGTQNYYTLDLNNHSFTETTNDSNTNGVFAYTKTHMYISCNPTVSAEKIHSKYANYFLCHMVQRRNGNIIYWRIVDSTFETYPSWMPLNVSGELESLNFGFVNDLMNEACKFTQNGNTISDALLKSMFFGSQNKEENSWHNAGALKNFINFGTDDRYIQFRGMQNTLLERNKMYLNSDSLFTETAENVLKQYSNGYSIDVKIAIFGTNDDAITNNTTDATLLSNVITGKYYIKKGFGVSKNFVFGFAEEP